MAAHAAGALLAGAHFPQQPNAGKVDCCFLRLLVSKTAAIWNGFIQVPCSEQEKAWGVGEEGLLLFTGWAQSSQPPPGCLRTEHGEGPRDHRPFQGRSFSGP